MNNIDPRPHLLRAEARRVHDIFRHRGASPEKAKRAARIHLHREKRKARTRGLVFGTTPFMRVFGIQ